MTYYAYTLVFDSVRVSSQTLRSEIDKLEAIVNWHAVMPSMLLIATHLDADDVCDLLKEQTSLKSGNHFLVMDTNTDRNGWLPKSAWAFMREPGPP